MPELRTINTSKEMTPEDVRKQSFVASDRGAVYYRVKSFFINTGNVRFDLKPIEPWS